MLFYLIYKLKKTQQEHELLFAQELIEDQVKQTLKSTQNALFTLALTIHENGEPKHFDSVSARLIETNPEFKTLELLPNGIVEHVYPLKGNESIIGFDILNDENNTKEARIALQKKDLHFAGPIELKQGGSAVVGRMPIFRSGKFWGCSVVIIEIDDFIKKVGISRLNKDHFQIAISKLNIENGKEDFFFGERVESKTKPDIFVESGYWNIYLSRRASRSDLYSFLLIIFTGVVFSVGSGWLIYKLLHRSKGELNRIFSEINIYLENSPLAIIEYNEKLEIIKWNKRSEEIFGWTEEEVIRQKLTAYSLVFRDDMDKARNIAKELLMNSSNGNTVHSRNVSKSGDVIHCVWYNSIIKDEKGNIISIISLVQDVSKEKMYEIELAKNEAELRLVVNSASELMVLLSIEKDGKLRIVSFNKAFKKFFDKAELKGVYLTELLGKEKIKDFKDKLKDVSEIGSSEYFESEIEINGNIFFLENRLNTLDDKKTMKDTVLLVSRDVTSKKQRRIKLDKTLELTKNQNDRLLNFAYIVSHNLRSHTSNISGILGLIKQTKEEIEKQGYLNYLEIVSRSLDETMVHLNQVVDIQTGKGLETQSINLYSRINHTVSLLQTEIENTESVIFNQVDKGVEVEFNPSYLDSVLLNFITNAIKYRSYSRNPIITFSSNMEGEYLVLSIEDNGLGIDLEKHKSNLFGLYKRFHEGAPGKGIGLFITKNQIEAMGGRLDLTSRTGVGTIFKVSFLKNVN